MSKLYDEITPEITAWVEKQHVFFVATAPLAEDGHINCSPKGLDTLRILGSRSVAYLDMTGSGAETIAHLRENGRIVFMFCSFDGAPKIVRFHGKGKVLIPTSPTWAEKKGPDGLSLYRKQKKHAKYRWTAESGFRVRRHLLSDLIFLCSQSSCLAALFLWRLRP